MCLSRWRWRLSLGWTGLLDGRQLGATTVAGAVTRTPYVARWPGLCSSGDRGEKTGTARMVATRATVATRNTRNKSHNNNVNSSMHTYHFRISMSCQMRSDTLCKKKLLASEGIVQARTPCLVSHHSWSSDRWRYCATSSNIILALFVDSHSCFWCRSFFHHASNRYPKKGGLKMFKELKRMIPPKWLKSKSCLFFFIKRNHLHQSTSDTFRNFRPFGTFILNQRSIGVVVFFSRPKKNHHAGHLHSRVDGTEPMATYAQLVFPAGAGKSHGGSYPGHLWWSPKRCFF